MADLGEAQPSAIRRHENRPVLEIERLLDDPGHLFAGEDLGQLLRLAPGWDGELRFGALERNAIEEPQSLGRDVAA